MITLENTSGHDVEVSIHAWDENGDLTYRVVKDGSNTQWERADNRGYVMSLRKGGGTKPYFVLKDSAITVKPHRVLDCQFEIESVERT